MNWYKPEWTKFETQWIESIKKDAQALLDSRSFKVAFFNGMFFDKYDFFSIKSLENFILLKKMEYIELDNRLSVRSHYVEMCLKELDGLLEKGKKHFQIE